MNVGIEENYFIVYFQDFYVLSNLKCKFIDKQLSQLLKYFKLNESVIHKI